MRLALVVRLDISEIPGVPVFTIWQPVLVAFRIIVAARAHAVRRRAIAILMDVESVLLAGNESFNIGDHLHRIALLGEAHHAMALLTSCGVQNSQRVYDRSSFGGVESDY